MSIKYVMLGFLSEEPQTGYDLKKKFSESDIFHWSGNNNQIYKALVDLHDEGLATIEVQQQDSKPPRKIYTITDKGLTELRRWVLSMPDMPQFRSSLAIQLIWADQVDPAALDKMLAKYEEELHIHVLMMRERANRRRQGSRSEISFSERIATHQISLYELELNFVRTLRQEITIKSDK